MKLGVHASAIWLALVGVAIGVLCNWGCKERSAAKAEKFELSQTLLVLVPEASRRVDSTNLTDRISVLDQIVAYRGDSCVRWYELPFDLPRSDYLSIANSVFAGGLRLEKNAPQTANELEKINFAATKLNLRELGQEFVPFLTSSDPTVQYVALDAIANLKPNGISSHVATLLAQPEWPIGRKALETLVALRAKEAIQPLASRLKSTNSIERWVAIKSLETVGDAAAAPHLQAQLNDPDVCNRYWVRQVLGELKAVRELRVALKSPASANEEAHTLAWLAIADDKEGLTMVAQYLLEGGRISPAMMRETLLKGGNVDSTAMPDTLSKPHSQQLWRHLAEWLRQGRSPSGKKVDEGVLREAALFMAQFGSREAISFLHELVKKPLPPERRYSDQTSGELARDRVVEALGKLRARGAVPELMALLNEKTAGSIYSVRVAEIALSQIADKTAAPALLERSRDRSHPFRSQILMNLNAAVDEPLWQRIETNSFQGLYVAPINTTAASITKQTGIPVVLHYEPADNKSWPVANTYVNTTTARFALERILEALKVTGTDYTVVLRKGETHIVSVEVGIAELAKVLGER